MSIRRTHLAFEDHYTQVPNQWVRDTRLTRKARGLLVELMSHRAGWDITIESLIRDGVEGRDAIRATLQELERFGYLERERERNADGTLAGVDYVIVDPWADEPTSDNPTLDDPPLKKTIPTEEHHQEPVGDPDEDADFAALWASWPKKEGKAEARRAYSRLAKRDRPEATRLLHVYGAAMAKSTPPRYYKRLSVMLRDERWREAPPVDQTRGAYNPEPPKPKGIAIPVGHRPVFSEEGYIIGSEPIA